MAIVPANVKTLSLDFPDGQNKTTFRLGVQFNPGSYTIVEGEDSNTKVVTGPDGTRFLARVNGGQLVTKIINPNNPDDLSARAWGKGAQGDSVSLQGSVLTFFQNLIKSNPTSANTNNWLAQTGTRLVNAVADFLHPATATFYTPGQGNIVMEGGTEDRRGNTLIGHRVEDIVAKLKEFKTQGLTQEQAIRKLKEGDHYIGVAADHTDPKNKYRTIISIKSDKLAQRFELNEIYEGLKFSDLHVRIVDTGGAFVGKGSGRLDIAMANITTAYDIGKVDLSWKPVT
jgi:hypothetical protein